MPRERLLEHVPGRPLQLYQDLRRGDGHPLAGSDVERHAGPTPRLDLEAERDERLDPGVRRHALRLAIPVVLAADDVVRPQRPDGLEQPHPLRQEHVAVESARWLHRDEGEDLQQVVLHDIARRADRVVEPATVADAEILGHRDLHALHEVPVPQRFEERVGEPEVREVLDGLAPEEVVDPEDRVLGEGAAKHRVQLSGAGQITTEGLLDDDARILRAARALEVLDHWLEQRRWDRQIEQGARRLAEPLPQSRERTRVEIVAVHVFEQLRQTFERALVDAAVLGEALAHPLEKRLAGPPRPGDADHRPVQELALHHRLERGEDLLIGEVAGDPEQHQRVGAPVAVSSRHDAHLSRLQAAPNNAGRTMARFGPSFGRSCGWPRITPHASGWWGSGAWDRTSPDA